MASFRSFEDIEAWQLARATLREFHPMTQVGEFSRDFVLGNHIRKSLISIMSNIAEGYERDGNKEFLQFLSMAKGSAGEARSQFYAALDLHYIDESAFKAMQDRLTTIGRMLNGLMGYLRNSGIKGRKYIKHPRDTP